MYFRMSFRFITAAWFYTKIYGYVLRESTNKINRLVTKTNQKKTWIVNVFSPISYCERITQTQNKQKPNRHCKAVQFSVDKEATGIPVSGQTQIKKREHKTTALIWLLWPRSSSSRVKMHLDSSIENRFAAIGRTFFGFNTLFVRKAFLFRHKTRNVIPVLI